jgi:steroid delta-isomerase-like uncharacterized protein
MIEDAESSDDPRRAANRATVERYLEALNAADAEAVIACVAEGFVNEHTAIGGRNRYGRDEYRTALTGFLTDFAELRYAPERLIADGDRVAVPYRMTFRHRPSGDAPVDVRGIFVFQLDVAGLIAHRIDYWDSGEVARQLGG